MLVGFFKTKKFYSKKFEGKNGKKNIFLLSVNLTLHTKLCH